MKRLLVILIVVLIKTSHVYAENPCNIMVPQNSGQWGLGFIWLSLGSKVALYDKPNGDKIGTLTRVEHFGPIFEMTNSQKGEINSNDLVYAAHVTIPLIKVYNINSEFLNVLLQSGNSGFWINIKELKDEIQYSTYRKLLMTPECAPFELRNLIRGANIGVNLINNCLNLRKGNDINSKVIKCISINKQEQSGHTHLKILETKSDWAKVEVTVYEYDSENDDGGEGCSFRVKEKHAGWIKYIDKDGHPNIWYSITAY